MPNKDDENSMNNFPADDNVNEENQNYNFEDMSGESSATFGEPDMTDSVVDDILSGAKEMHEASEHYNQQNEKSVDGTVTAQPVKFASFEDLDSAHGLANQNLGILLDVKLQLTVELGKTELPIKKVLELTKGSVVTLDKVAGEPVELYANGKLIAHGEVVVIEDNFGLRITHITPPVKRIDTFTHLPHESLQQ